MPKSHPDTVYIYGFTDNPQDALLLTLKLFGWNYSLAEAKRLIDSVYFPEECETDLVAGEGVYVVEECPANGAPGVRWTYAGPKRGWQKYDPSNPSR